MSRHTSDAVCPLCEEKLLRAHPELINWFRCRVKPNYPNAHVSWSYRNRVDQEQAFSEGKSHLQYPDSAHNKVPAMALDLFEIIQGKATWSPGFFMHLNLDNHANQMPIKWGGQFKSFGDADHFELIFPV